MPIVAACPYCPTRVKVPDHLLGASFGCPKCGNCFTVAPAESLPVRKPDLAPPPTPRPAPPPPAPAADAPWWVSSEPAAPAPAPAVPEPPPPAPPPAPIIPAYTLPLDYPEPSASSLSASPGWVNTWGGLAFSLTAIGLLLAAFSLPRWATLALAALGFVLSVLGALASLGQWKIKDVVWLILGGGGSGLLLLVTLIRPGWVNDRWGMDFEVPEPDRNKQMMVSHDNQSEVKELSSGDRVDAQKNAIRQGDVLIRIEGATVDSALDREPLLLIRLHISNVGPLHNVTYRGQASGEAQAVVRDSRGKELSPRDLGEKARKVGQIGTVTILPTHEVKDVLAVEAPWSGTDSVDVDLPSAAWGCEGTCRFTIPAVLIARKNRGR